MTDTRTTPNCDGLHVALTCIDSAVKLLRERGYQDDSSTIHALTIARGHVREWRDHITVSSAGGELKEWNAIARVALAQCRNRSGFAPSFDDLADAVARALHLRFVQSASTAITPPSKERDPNFWPNGVWKCGSLMCQPPCRCDPPVPTKHKPVA